MTGPVWKGTGPLVAKDNTLLIYLSKIGKVSLTCIVVDQESCPPHEKSDNIAVTAIWRPSSPD